MVPDFEVWIFLVLAVALTAANLVIGQADGVSRQTKRPERNEKEGSARQIKRVVEYISHILSRRFRRIERCMLSDSAD